MGTSVGQCVRLAATILLPSIALVGCGTTKWSDTKRTATEQLLISDAVDRAVSELNFTPLREKSVFFDSQYLAGITDEKYVVSSLRQHILASGCILKEKREEADYVVEARSGGVGTDRADVLYGLPATNLPPLSVPGIPSSIPEVALGRKTEQHGVAKLAVFAYYRESGRPYWQSGINQMVSHAKDVWILGVGPVRSGTVQNQQQFVGNTVNDALRARFGPRPDALEPVPVARELFFPDHPEFARRKSTPAPAIPSETTPADPESGVPPVDGPPSYIR